MLPAQGGAAVAGGGCVRRQGAVGGGLGVRGDGRRRQVVRGVVVEAGQVREGALGKVGQNFSFTLCRSALLYLIRATRKRLVSVRERGQGIERTKHYI